jgi:ElaB/YqjD/DUF883 family membrane-anchored ribosome-binding protein
LRDSDRQTGNVGARFPRSVGSPAGHDDPLRPAELATPARRLSAAQAEADRIAAAAQREAERLRDEVVTEAEAVRSRVRAESDQMREQARLDVDQLHEVRASPWLDIEGIADRINAELARDREGARSAGFSGPGLSALSDRGNVLDAGGGRSTE